MAFLLNSQAQGVSGKNEQSTKHHGTGPNAAASVLVATGGLDSLGFRRNRCGSQVY